MNFITIHSSKNKYIKYVFNNAFTLIELIVAVAIATVLFTAGYIAFESSMTTSKDAYRLEDMLTLKSAMNLTKEQKGGYPYPDEYFTIVNSGTSNEEVYQGYINSNVLISELTNIPKDPTTGNQYVLSTTKTKQQYQIGMTLENKKTDKAYVDGDYNTISLYLFPSLILAQNGTGIVEINSGSVTNGSTGAINRTKFILNGSKINLPYNISDGLLKWEHTSYEDLIAELGTIISRNNDYYNCKEIFDDKKYLGPGYYDLIDASGSGYSLTYCTGIVVNTSCIGLPISASYFGGATTYSPLPAINLSAVYNVNATVNTCQFNCNSGYSRSGGICSMLGNDSYTKLLLHFDGVNNSTSFIDSESTPKIITPSGNSKITTSQSKYGGTSGYFDGTGDYLKVPDSTDLDLSASDFTIDFWVDWGGNAYGVPLARGLYTNGYYFQFISGELRFYSNNNSNYLSFGTIHINEWHHIALVKSGSLLSTYNNGIFSASGSFSVTNGTGDGYVGCLNASEEYCTNSFIDELRISKGIARRSTNFIPPTTQYY